MTKITTDFVGSETIAVTKQRLTDILAYWGATTAAYTTWGQARTALNALLTSTTAGTIGSTELAGSFLPKINFLNDPDDMIADALFGASEQGVWLDPSDVANVAWRRNLLLQSEAFDLVSEWPRADVSVTANAATAPDGTMTADLLVESATNANHLLNKSGVFTSVTGTYTLSCYAKASTRNWFRLQSQSTLGAWVNVNLSTGAVGLSGTGITNVSVVSAGNGWYRISGAVTVSAQPVSAQLFVIDSDRGGGGPSYLGDGTSGILIWGAQLETGTVATEYQRITDLNTEVIARFPNATMYQDAAGTTPVYAPGQPVGLRLDKSKGLVLGPEISAPLLVSSGWTTDGCTITTNGAGLDFAFTAVNKYAFKSISTVAGKWYRFTIQKTGIPINLGWSTSGFSGDLLYLTGVSATTITGNFLATTTSSVIGIAGSGAGTATISNISVKELAGNHATQSTLGSRPMYGIEPKGGRRNLLTFSEVFSDSAWIKASGAAITANTDTAPDGTLTADTLTTSGTPSFSGGLITQAVSVAATGVTFTFSAYLKASSTSKATIWINLAGGAERVAVVVNLTSSYQRYTVSATFTSGSIVYPHVVAGDANLGTNAGSVSIWGAQLELGSTATNYQRVTTAFDVTEAGVNSCHYCEYDGINGGMITNSIDFTATDKMSVFAGVRKLGSTTGVIVETSSDTFSFNGSFVVLSGSSGGENYEFYGKGTSFAGRRGVTYTPPISNVLSVAYDISQPTDATEIVPRVNGVTPTLTTLFGNMGTGNFGNYRLNIGRRGNDQPTPALPLKGRDYGIIITGKLANATAIATTEMWLANKTAGVTL